MKFPTFNIEFLVELRICSFQLLYRGIYNVLFLSSIRVVSEKWMKSVMIVLSYIMHFSLAIKNWRNKLFLFHLFLIVLFYTYLLCTALWTPCLTWIRPPWHLLVTPNITERLFNMRHRWRGGNCLIYDMTLENSLSVHLFGIKMKREQKSIVWRVKKCVTRFLKLWTPWCTCMYNVIKICWSKILIRNVKSWSKIN